MLEYKCDRCDETHRMITLMEYPTPDIVSNISSGKLDLELNVFDENIYLLDRSYTVMRVELVVNLINYDDEVVFLPWVEVTKEEMKSHIENQKLDVSLPIKGKLMHDVLFYENSKSTRLEFNEDLVVVDVIDDNKLKTDFESGISLKEYKDYLCRIANY